MSEPDNNLFAIDLSADDYGETAANETPPVSRTHQSEDAFQAIKSTYTAKIDGGNTYKHLIAAVPALAKPLPGRSHDDSHENHENHENLTNEMKGDGGLAKVKLTKKDVQLLGYAVGEMYFDRDYVGVVDLCERVKAMSEVDERVNGDLTRWIGRARERMG